MTQDRSAHEFQILNVLDEAILIADEAGHVSFLNQAAEKLYGLPLSQAGGRHINTVVSIEESPVSVDEILREVKEHGRWRGDLVHVAADGRRIWIDWSLGDFATPGDKKPAVIAVARDISHRKQTEHELKDSRENYRRLTENAQDVIWRTDHMGRVVYVNSVVEQIYGITPEQAIGIPMSEYFTPESVNRVLKLVADGLSEEPMCLHYRCEVDSVRRDGTLVPCELNANMILDEKRQLFGFEGITRDFTERKRAELALRESEKKLMEQNFLLEQKNIALREIMDQVKAEKARIEKQIQTNVDQLLLPLLENWRAHHPLRDATIIELLEENLKTLTSSFGQELSRKMLGLTSREIEICNMIKNGLASKEIAALINISPRGVDTHRRNIRRKLGLTKQDINLTTYLKSI